MKNQRMQKERGITLVTLVITIIILIILATISIDAIWGQNGLFKQAQETKESAENSVLSSEADLNAISQEYANMMAEDTELPEEPPKTVAEAKPEEGEDIYYFKDTTKITDDSGDPIWIPGDFGIPEDSATEIDEGVVITDGTNEFVWIPVDSTSLGEMYEVKSAQLSQSALGPTGVSTSVYSKLRIRSEDSFTAGAPGIMSNIVREPDILISSSDGDVAAIDSIKSIFQYEDDSNHGILSHFAQEMVNEYEATYESIKHYEGFYIGRYELTGTVKNPTVQKDKRVLAGTDTENWYGLKKACTDVVSSKYAQTEMIYGNQWDEVMDWLKQTKFKNDTNKVDVDSTSWGNYGVEGAGAKRNSGYNEAWSANNIYDLAGNYFEFTQEADNINYRIMRRRRLLFHWFCCTSCL